MVPDTYTTLAEFNLVPGEYSVGVVGLGLTQFSISILLRRGDESKKSRFEGIIDKGQTVSFRFTYSSDPSQPVGSIEKVVTPATLIRYVRLYYKNNWIHEEGVMNSLIKKVEAAEAAITRGNKKSARGQLEAFMNEVNAQNRWNIIPFAAEPLLKEAQYLIDSL